MYIHSTTSAVYMELLLMFHHISTRQPSCLCIYLYEVKYVMNGFNFTLRTEYICVCVCVPFIITRQYVKAFCSYDSLISTHFIWYTHIMSFVWFIHFDTQLANPSRSYVINYFHQRINHNSMISQYFFFILSSHIHIHIAPLTSCSLIHFHKIIVIFFWVSFFVCAVVNLQKKEENYCYISIKCLKKKL